MKCIVSHTSACAWLVHHATPRTTGDRASRAGITGACVPPASYREKLRFMLDLHDGPVDFLVERPGDLRRNADAVAHLCTCDLPAGSFIQVPSGSNDVELYVTSPELTYVQLAYGASMQMAAYVGMALCSDYRLDPFSVGGVLQRPSSDARVTTVARLRNYVERAARVCGRKRAAAALDLVWERSRSPKESGLALFYGMPVRFGGMSLGDVTMNPRVRVFGGVDMLGHARYEERYPDILISRSLIDGGLLAVAFDYDADSVHAGSEKALEDRRRTNSIATVDNLLHFSVSTTDLDDITYLRLLGDRARRALKLRSRPPLQVARTSAEGRQVLAEYRERQERVWQEVVVSRMPF